MESRTDQLPHKTVLIADGDPKSLRVLEVSLRNAGFDVLALRDGTEADAWLDRHVPALVIADTALAGVDGFELGRRIKRRAGQGGVPLLLVGEPTVENRVEAVKSGAEELLGKPVYVKEIIGRVSLLLRRQEREQMQAQREGQNRFAGDLADMSIVDLLQTVEASRRSGVIELHNRQKSRAEIYFRQGAAIDAEVGRLSGLEAMFRLFSWSEGKFQIEFKSIRRRDAIEMPARALVIEGMERLDEWTRLVRDLPPLSTVFEVDYRLLADRLSEIPDEVNGILRLFDGIRTLMQVMDDCGLADRDVLTIVGRLHGEGIIRDVRLRREAEPARGPDLDGWLTEAAGPFRSPMEAARDQSDAEVSLPRMPVAQAEPEVPDDVAAVGDGVPAGAAAAAEIEEPSQEALEEQRERFTNRLHIESVAAAEMAGFEEFARELGAPAPGEDAIPSVRANEPAVVIPFPALEGDRRETLPPAMMSPEIASDIAPARATDQGLGPLPMPMDLAVAPAPVPPDPAPLPPAPDPAAPRDEASFSQVSKRWMDQGDDLSHAEALDEMGLPPRFRGLMIVAATVVVVAGGLLGLQRWRGGKEPPEAISEAGKPGEKSAADKSLADKSDKAAVPPAAKMGAETAEKAAAEKPATVAVENAPPAAAPAPPAAAHAPPAPPPPAGATQVAHKPAAVEARPHPPAPASPPPAKDATKVAAAVPAPAVPKDPAKAAPAVKDTSKAAGGSAPGAPVAVNKVATPRPENRPAAAAPAPAPVPAASAADFPRLLGECRRAFEKGRMRDATAACTLAKDANPDSGEALVLLAHSEFNRNHRKEALAWAEKAIKADPKLADAYVIMGGVQQDSGRNKEAKWAYKKYLELAPRGQYASDLRAIVDTL